jgi:hypothetical protein
MRRLILKILCWGIKQVATDVVNSNMVGPHVVTPRLFNEVSKHHRSAIKASNERRERAIKASNERRERAIKTFKAHNNVITPRNDGIYISQKGNA